MSIHVFSTAEKLAEVERMIIDERRDGGHRNEIMMSIASDLRARLAGAPSVALLELERRLVTVKRSKTPLGYGNGQLVGLAQELVARWPCVKQALERFGAEIENAENAS